MVPTYVAVGFPGDVQLLQRERMLRVVDVADNVCRAGDEMEA